MSIPKKHHYVPQWLIKKWAQPNGKVLGIDRRDPDALRPFRQLPVNINAQNHLYSVEGSDGIKDPILETDLYAPLDEQAEKLTSLIIECLDEKVLPQLDFNARRLLWQFYIYNAVKRHPRPIREIYHTLNDEERAHVKELAAAHLIERGHDPAKVVKDLDEYDFDNNSLALAIQIARSDQDEKTLDQLAKLDVLFVIAPPGKGFILPDLPFELIRPGAPEKLKIIPIHPKYAVVPCAPDASKVKLLAGAQVRRLNEGWYRNGVTVLSVSEQLLISLANYIDGQDISFPAP